MLARRFFDRFEPVHAVTYFAPEARAALDGLGYRGFWMGYFAARSAPLGMVPREVVTAIFYNFAPERVAKALPAAWQIAGPDAALRARQESAVAALRRYGLGLDRKLSVSQRNWREGRRDSRRWTAVRFSPRTWRCRGRTIRWPRCGTRRRCCASSAATGTWRCWPPPASQAGNPTCYTPRRAGFRASTSRAPAITTRRRGVTTSSAWPSEGCCNDDGSLTTAGRELKDHIERSTDTLALSALDALGDDEVETLFRALTPITRAVVAGGDVPALTPMTLRRDELHDDRAHLPI